MGNLIASCSRSYPKVKQLAQVKKWGEKSINGCDEKENHPKGRIDTTRAIHAVGKLDSLE